MSAQCYDWNENTNAVGTLPKGIWVQCPAGLGCCVEGDTCLDHNICHAAKTQANNSTGSYSSYYMSRCTDPTYSSSYCRKTCSAPGPPDAVYNETTQQWASCGNDASRNVSCDAPTNELFQAPAPAQLAVISSGASVATTATIVPGSKTATTTSGTSATATTSSSVDQGTAFASPSASTSTPVATSQASSSSLSTGAQAGIGVGVALAVIAITAALVFVWFKRKRSVQAQDTSNGPIYLEKDNNHIRPELAGEDQVGSSHELVSPTQTKPPAYPAYELDAR